MAEAWGERRKKKRRSPGVVFLISAAVIVLAVFLQNNFNIFSFAVKKAEPDSTFGLAPETAPAAGDHTVETDVSAEPAPETPHQAPAPIPEPVVTPAAHTPAATVPEPPARHLSPTDHHSVPVSNILCVLAGDDRQQILVSLRLLFKAGSLADDVLLKRDEIRVIVQKVFSTKLLNEIEVDRLRAEIRQETNRLFDGGGITDIEFDEFRPTEM
jgi:hypothetical protein